MLRMSEMDVAYTSILRAPVAEHEKYEEWENG
jgi:hypothetical protein